MKSIIRTARGFTLLEMLIVIVIIGILAAIALPGYMRTREKALVAEAKQILSAMRQANIRYQLEHDNVGYTNSCPDLDVDVPGGCDGSTNIHGWEYSLATGGGPPTTTCTATAERQSTPALPTGITSGDTVTLNCTSAGSAGFGGTHPLR